MRLVLLEVITNKDCPNISAMLMLIDIILKIVLPEHTDDTFYF